MKNERCNTTMLSVFAGASAGALALAVGCASVGRLAEYDFRGTTVAVVQELPPYPEVLTGPYFPGHPRDPVHVVMEVGGKLAKEIEASELRPRLAEAAELVDISERIADRALRRATLELGARGVDEPANADFIFEIVVRDYGVDAEEWLAAAHFFVDAEVALLERQTGVLVWERHVRARDPLAPHVFGGRSVIRDVVTAAAFASLDTHEIAVALEHLADYSADRIADELRDSLEEVRSETGRLVAN